MEDFLTGVCLVQPEDLGDRSMGFPEQPAHLNSQEVDPWVASFPFLLTRQTLSWIHSITLSIPGQHSRHGGWGYHREDFACHSVGGLGALGILALKK